jgi:hypothetical protein
VLIEGALPLDPTGRLLVPFRAGDVLRISAPFVETVAASVDEREAILRWPWRRVDPASEMLWTDRVWGFPFAELHKTLWRTEPPFTRLRTGQRCRVGVPSTVFHVVEVELLDTPRDTGMLPRPSGWITVLPEGATFDPTDREPSVDVELIAAVQPDGRPTPGVEAAESIRMALVFRPYAYLDDGDVVTDSNGHRWRFEVPLWWREVDGPDGPGPRWVGAPEWPLTLAPEVGDAVRAAEVAAATASGSHDREVARWKELTRAEPVPIRPYVDED